MAHSHTVAAGGHAGHDHAAGVNARGLIVALGLTGTFVLAELVGAWWFNSLALLSDAAHMFTDAAALGIALAALRIGKKAADVRRTYGYRRFEVLAAAFNAVLLCLVAGYVLYEGVLRFLEPEPVQSLGMLWVATIGLLVNILAMRALASGRDKSLNLKGAYLEVWADMLGSLGVMGAAILIYITGWRWVDPLVAIGIGLWVLPRTWVLLRDTTHILLQGVPGFVDLEVVRTAVSTVPGVESVHDLHVWSVAGNDASLTVHVVLLAGVEQDRVRKLVSARLEADFGIHNPTIQTELEPCADVAVLHP